jgi:hypothetical protein
MKTPARWVQLAAGLPSTLLLVAACQSSGRYGTPATAAAAVGVGAIGAGLSRAAGGCLAVCFAGTRCNRATGLCEPEPVAASAAMPSKKKKGHGSSVAVGEASYAPGHEYEVPPLGGADAGCDPVASEAGDGGAVACEMDGGAI